MKQKAGYSQGVEKQEAILPSLFFACWVSAQGANGPEASGSTGDLGDVQHSP